MHRLILGITKQSDMCDHDGLNNQRANLRIGTTAQNMFNIMSKSGSSACGDFDVLSIFLSLAPARVLYIFVAAPIGLPLAREFLHNGLPADVANRSETVFALLNPDPRFHPDLPLPRRIRAPAFPF
jgi:hypothetical protein